jgi:hypothetical protein
MREPTLPQQYQERAMIHIPVNGPIGISLLFALSSFAPAGDDAQKSVPAKEVGHGSERQRLAGTRVFDAAAQGTAETLFLVWTSKLAIADDAFTLSHFAGTYKTWPSIPMPMGQMRYERLRNSLIARDPAGRRMAVCSLTPARAIAGDLRLVLQPGIKTPRPCSPQLAGARVVTL